MFDKIIIYGGSFNPLTLGHCAVAVEAVKYMNNRFPKCPVSLWFMPTKGDLYGEKDLIDVNHRLNMIRLFCSYMNASLCKEMFIASKFDATQEKQLTTYQVMDALKEIHLCCDFYFLMGEDSFIRLSEWKDHEKLLREHELVIVERPNGGISSLSYAKVRPELLNFHKHRVINPTMVRSGISSTKARKALDGCRYYVGSVQKYISKSVFEYIQANNLYNIELSYF